MIKCNTRFYADLYKPDFMVALYSWHMARHFDGNFYIRMNDAEYSRSCFDLMDKIQKKVQDLGMDFNISEVIQGLSGHLKSAREISVMDCPRERWSKHTTEGVVYQSLRTHAYSKILSVLEQKELSYPCFCPSRIKNSCKCFNLNSVELADEFTNKRFRTRFRAKNTGKFFIEDELLGRIPVEQIDDFTLVEKSGKFSYHLMAVADDIAMNITHIVQRQSLLRGSMFQFALHLAIGNQPPKFAHLSDFANNQEAIDHFYNCHLDQFYNKHWEMVK